MSIVNKRITIHTEQLNRSGYWIKTDGIDLSNFEKNNIVLYEHEFGQRIGLGVNLRKEENGDLTAEIDFNENSDLGKQLKLDFENGYLKAASIGVLPRKFSKDNQNLKDGQSKPTMTESELLEFSLVSVPNNAGAVVFKQGAEGYVKLGISDLTFDETSDLEDESSQTKHKISQMKKIAVVLGLAETASEEDILKKIADLQGAMAINTEALGKAIIGLGVKTLVITDANKPTYERLTKVDLGLALEMVSEKIDLGAVYTQTATQTTTTEGTKPADVRVTEIVSELKKQSQTEETKKYDQSAAKKHPETFQGGKSMQERMSKHLYK